MLQAMTTPPKGAAQESDRKELERELVCQYGLVIGHSHLYRVLGYRTGHALRQADARGTLPVKVFAVPGRRGKFAFARDVADWLIALRSSVDADEGSSEDQHTRSTEQSSKSGIGSHDLGN